MQATNTLRSSQMVYAVVLKNLLEHPSFLHLKMFLLTLLISLSNAGRTLMVDPYNYKLYLMLYLPSCITEKKHRPLNRISRRIVQSLMIVAQRRYQDCIACMRSVLKPKDAVLYFGAGAGGSIVDYAIHENIELHMSDVDSRAYHSWQKLMRVKHWSKRHIHYVSRPVDVFNANKVVSLCKKVKPSMVLIIGLFEYFDGCHAVNNLGKNMLSIKKIRAFFRSLKNGCVPGTKVLFTFPNVLNKKTAFVQQYGVEAIGFFPNCCTPAEALSSFKRAGVKRIQWLGSPQVPLSNELFLVTL